MKHRFVLLAAIAALISACAPPHASTSTAASPTAQATTVAAQTSNEAPPMENGVYIAHGICFGEGGCPWKNWRASERVEVRERADASSPVLAVLQPGDWVEALEGVDRFVPRRGVVRTANQELEVGDVIYLLESEGEGDYTIWRRGETRSWHWPDDENDQSVAWDPRSERNEPTLGWWVHVKLANGKDGWINNPQFECMGPLGGSEGCRG